MDSRFEEFFHADVRHVVLPSFGFSFAAFTPVSDLPTIGGASSRGGTGKQVRQACVFKNRSF